MAYVSNIIAKVVGRTGSPKNSLPCMLLNLDSSVVSSGSTTIDGRVVFTGISAGVYNIKVIGSSGNYFLNTYELKNSYVLPIGESSAAFESRTFVRSSDVIGGSGVLTQNKVLLTGITAGGYTGTTIYYSPFDQVPVTGINTLTKQTGNSYYHLNQNLMNVQRVQIAIGE